MDFLYSWPGMVSLGVILAALIGLLLYMQKKQQD